MKRFIYSALFLLAAQVPVQAQSEAGSIFLLISPSARAAGMGEAHVAVADDAYASFWNPAGLAFLEGSELAFMHVNWLPNLADDMYYDFFAFRTYFPNIGALGGHIIYLGLGEQIRMGETADDYLGTFSSYMLATSLSYSTLLSEKSSIGINAKISYQHLADIGAGAEKGKGSSTDFGFDIGYLKREFITQNLTMGLTIKNIGPKVSFIDPAQADPQPTNFTFGLNYKLFDNEYNKLNMVYDINKLLVASYPDMDWDGDGYVGGYDSDGKVTSKNAYYNKTGKKESAHTDPLYLAIFTSWVDDWLIGGDIDMSTAGNIPDGVIGGWNWVDKNGNGKIDVNEGEMEETAGDPGDANWGNYNEYGQKEVGSADKRSISDELGELVHNIGFEYWYSSYFALRFGYIYDKTGSISNPTLGIGLRYSNYGFDFGYTAGEVGHPLTNTMRFSLNMLF